MASSRWCFTLNNPDLEEIADFHILCADGEEVVYSIFGDEVGDNGTAHVQGFVVFKAVKRLSFLKKLLARAHWERARASSLQAAEYCKKDGNFVEYGVCPVDRRFTSSSVSESNLAMWDEARQLARAGKFDEIRSDLYIRYRGAFHSIFDDSCNATQCINELNHLWIYGSTGIGKSRYCYESYPGAFRKPLNKWWDHYTNQDVVIIEDVDPSHCKWLGHYLKIWSDHYPFIAERKGGSKQIRPEQIIVTSNYRLAGVFEDDGIHLPLLRRFREVTIADGNVVPVPGVFGRRCLPITPENPEIRFE